MTLAALRQRLAEWREQYKPEALGIGSFGPIALDKSDADYGHMLATPSPAGQGRTWRVRWPRVLASASRSIPT